MDGAVVSPAIKLDLKMKKTAYYTLFLGALCTGAQAGLVDSRDTRTQGMGGAGVAGSYGAAAFKENPANLLSGKYRLDVSVNLAAAVTDAEDTLDDLDALSQQVGPLEQVIDDASSAGVLNPGDLSVSDPRFTILSNEANNFVSTARRLDGESLNADISLQMSFAISPQDSDWAYGVMIGASAEVIAATDNIDADLDKIQIVADALGDGNVTADEITAISATGLATRNGSGIEFNAGSFDAQAEGRALLGLYTETGIGIARRFELAGQELVLGITPKIVTLVAVEINELAENFDSDTLDDDDITQDKSFFSADVGVRYESPIAGLVFAGSAHNLIGDELKTDVSSSTVPGARPTKVQLKPKLAVGVAKSSTI